MFTQKWFKITSRVLISISLPIVVIMFFATLLTTTPYLNISKGLYPSHADIDYDHDYAADRIMGYLNYRYPDLICDETLTDNCYYMTQGELDHMADVLDVYTMLRIVAIISLIIAISLSLALFKSDRKYFHKTYQTIYVVPAVFILFMGTYILIDFNAAFTMFHDIFFPQGGYLFSSNSVLIRLLPGDFWMVSGVLILGFSAITVALIVFFNNRNYKKYLVK